MNGDRVLDVARIAAGQRDHERQRRRALTASITMRSRSRRPSLRQPQAAELIVLVRIGARQIEDALRIACAITIGSACSSSRR